MVLSAGWCPIARIGCVDGIFGEEIGVIFLHFTWTEGGLLGELSAFFVIQFRLFLDIHRWPFLISAHIGTALINCSNWFGLIDGSRFLRHWCFFA